MPRCNDGIFREKRLIYIHALFDSEEGYQKAYQNHITLQCFKPLFESSVKVSFAYNEHSLYTTVYYKPNSSLPDFFYFQTGNKVKLTIEGFDEIAAGNALSAAFQCCTNTELLELWEKYNRLASSYRR